MRSGPIAHLDSRSSTTAAWAPAEFGAARPSRADEDVFPQLRCHEVEMFALPGRTASSQTQPYDVFSSLLHERQVEPAGHRFGQRFSTLDEALTRQSTCRGDFHLVWLEQSTSLYTSPPF